ncbi:MAG: DUF6252 family protein [Patiriisocius sp.]|uniref:DUF6252 family protein n=1 Tax=Patiriisocius sp. TaxID=2822396 RepID=UPI003EF72FDA
MNIQFKKLATITILSMSLCLGLTSCNKSDDAIIEEQMGQGDGDDDGNPIDLSANFSASIDGETFIPTEVTASKIAIDNQVGLTIGATNGDKYLLSIVVQAGQDLSIISLDPGTYDFDNNSYALLVKTNPDDSQVYTTTIIDGGSGTFTIASHNRAAKTISGTFNFVSTNVDNTVDFNVTNGAFDITYITN